MNCQVYKLYSDKTDKIYIGATRKSLEERLAKHQYSFNEGRSILFYNWLRENNLSPSDFKIKKVCDAREEDLFLKEAREISLTSDINLNLKSNTNKKYKVSEEGRANISKSLRGNSRRKGTSTTLEGKRNMSKAQLKIKNVKCPYCGIEGKPSIMARWHFDKCRNKL